MFSLQPAQLHSRLFLAFLVLLLLVRVSYGQQPAVRQLDTVVVRSFSPERYMAGLKVQRVDSALLARFQFTTLADFLAFQAPIAFKSYGPGQLTTISFRGTSANHTAVLWNGVNINQPTLGQSDFSTLPLLGFDQMSIQYGSAASCVGTDAVGGSILLTSAPRWKQRGWTASAGGQFDTFHNGQGQLGLRFTQQLRSGWHLAGKTMLYGSQYLNRQPGTSRTDWRGYTYAIEPSHTTQQGLVQDLYARNSKGTLWSVNVWLTDNTLTIQPDQVDLRETTKSKAYRFLTGLQLGGTALKAGFIRDIIDYGIGDFSAPSHSETNRYLLRAEHEFNWVSPGRARQTNLRIGAEGVRYTALVDGYGPTTLHQNRADLWVLLRHSFTNKLTASLNLRQAFASDFKPPFTPSLGVEYGVLTDGKFQVTLSGNVARSYRVPTLNERYWRVLGNPDIKPEDGVNKEIGVTGHYTVTNALTTSLSVNAYHNRIKNWTYWNPAKNYHVENLQEVLAQGLEVTSTSTYSQGKTTARLALTYALTHTSQQHVYDAYAADVIGKQLVYVPVHTLTATGSVGLGKWNLTLQGLYNSDRYITFDHSGQPFPPYALLNAVVSTRLKLGGVDTDILAGVQNLTNTVYPNVKKNAMPGSSGRLSLIFHVSQF